MAQILLAHGSGGRLTHDFIKNVVIKKYGNPMLNRLTDSALFEHKKGKFYAFTTDSFVVDPVFFNGGDIGKLAVCGTVNDLAVCGAKPLYLSVALIIEEGMDELKLSAIMESISSQAKVAGVKIITGDTKVVEKGGADTIFINTSGIGIVAYKKILSLKNIRPGDKILINGPIADHGISVLLERKELAFKTAIKSDCACLNRLIMAALAECGGVKFMRDPTRGGLAATLNEMAEGMPFGIRIFEKTIPLNEGTKAACELLGLDPLYIGNEGKVIMVVSAQDAKKALRILRRDKLGMNSSVIGEITEEHKGRVVLRTNVGGERIVDMPVMESIPRIC